MENSIEQVITFIDKCKELKSCKFIMATGKIRDLLKHIVNSPDLYELFSAVTRDFDYIKTRKKCLVDATDGIVNRSYIVLPDTIGERLAFIFCLLVDIDKENINFNWLLQRYFAEDGSYYASYQVFCEKIVDSLIDILNDVFSQEISKYFAEKGNNVAKQNELQYETFEGNQEQSSDLASAISSISILISQEKDFISNTAINDGEKDSAYKILDEILLAVRSNSISTVNALMLGYNYFISYYGVVSETISALIENIAIFERLI